LIIGVTTGAGSMVFGDEFAIVGAGWSTVYNAELPPVAALRDGLVLAPQATPNLLFVFPETVDQGSGRNPLDRPEIKLPKMPAQAPFQVVADVGRDRLYVISSGGTVATITKASSAKPVVAYHAVKLGGGHFDAAWAGSARIAFWGESGLGTIDTRTWATRAIAPGVSGAVATRYGIAAWTKTPDGIAVYTPTGTRRFRLLQGQQVTAARAVGPYLYADTALRARYAIDLRTGKTTGPLPTGARIVTPSYVVIP
jgi:hypothetical protein